MNSCGNLVDAKLSRACKKKPHQNINVTKLEAKEKAGLRPAQVLANLANSEAHWYAQYEMVEVKSVVENQPSQRVRNKPVRVLRLPGKRGCGFEPLKSFKDNNEEAERDKTTETRTIHGLRLTQLTDVVEKLKEADSKFNWSKNSEISAFLHLLTNSLKFEMVQGHDLRKHPYEDNMKWLFVHPLFDPNDPDSIKKIVTKNIEKNPDWFDAKTKTGWIA